MAARTWFCIGFVLLLAACGAQPKREEAMLNELAAMLPGSYDNLAQSRANADHAPLRLVIAPVQAPLVGDHVFYVQEMAADDPRRVLAQRLYVLNSVPGTAQATLTQLDFIEPTRWRDGHLNRDLFRGMLTQDLRVRPNCDLVWSRADKGFKSLMGTACRTSSRATGEALKVEERMELDADGIAVFEQHRDAAGTLVYGGETDPWYRFARRADAPW
jgi:hypothetical protein